MEIITKQEDETLTMQIDGNIDTVTAPEFEKELKISLTDEVSELIFDFEKVPYMSSAGIRVIMAADKVMQKQGNMKLINVNEEIMEIFEVTGLVDLLNIE